MKGIRAVNRNKRPRAVNLVEIDLWFGLWLDKARRVVKVAGSFFFELMNQLGFDDVRMPEGGQISIEV